MDFDVYLKITFMLFVCVFRSFVRSGFGGFVSFLFFIFGCALFIYDGYGLAGFFCFGGFRLNI